ncbi:MAG: staygreen family protein [Clostridium sp.]
MGEFKKEKLHVNFRDGVEKYGPSIPRCYTLTHSDITGDLFLDIGKKHSYEKITSMRDEVLGEWGKLSGGYILKIDLHVDGALGNGNVEIRDMIFRRELPLALKAIVYGDRELILGNENLKKASIIVNFNSMNEKYNKVEYWGDVEDYLEGENLRVGNLFGKGLSDYGGDKDNIILTLLSSKIEEKICEIYGANTNICVRDTQLISTTLIEEKNGCHCKYKVNVGVRISFNVEPQNNFIITFVIDKTNIEIANIKHYKI